MRTEYVTWVNAIDVYRGEDLESAIRTWDAETYQRGGEVAGGVAVHTWMGDVMVRDGWVLHVRDDGTVYLNPNLRES